ncbi:MAG: SDR family NAD(P)-dependent oxidoreductase [Bilophila sp.]
MAGDRGRASNYVYGAAKAGFTAYLAGLRARLWRRGVHVLTVKPGYVATRTIEGRRLPRWLVASPERVGRDICRAALSRRDGADTPGWWRPVLAAYRALPECLAKRWSSRADERRLV